ncbi:Rv2253/PknI dimerization domain-containing protein [Mycolicibacterium stellerae]|uniref:hypothetical protein n=1 Tax=Mycolicibacterium stellerae TaxID=2358193 RepID=UPI000F0B3487|nr:hypothetical protein [Mycolicibacterium stellerae]
MTNTSQRRLGAVYSAVALLGLGMAATAEATQQDWAINGVYRATSNGEWATTNDVYHDEATVVSQWTISSTCTGPDECTGEVTSDLGWRASIYTTNGLWYVRRTVEGWQTCADNTASDGAQVYTFYPVDEDGQVAPGSGMFAGQDTTIGESGACGVNQWLAIRLPFTLARLS